TFQTDVELKLRQAGIKVLNNDERLRTPGMPYLYVNINPLHQRPGEMGSYSIRIEVTQNATLERNGEFVVVPTWSDSAAGTGDVSNTRSSVKDLVDEFLNAWLSVNPKK